MAGRSWGGRSLTDREKGVHGLCAGLRNSGVLSLLCETGILAIIAILLFGFFLWSTFAVAVAMSHELLPQNIGLASGIMLGLAIGFGGLGVAVNGMIADHYSLATALGTIPIPIAGALC